MEMLVGTGLVDTFRLSDLQGQVIVMFLCVGSIFIWSVVAAKFTQLRRARKSGREFLAMYRQDRDPLGLFLRGVEMKNCPLYNIYRMGCEEASSLLTPTEDGIRRSSRASALAVAERKSTDSAAIRAALDRAIDSELVKLESQMSLLSTAVTGGPFLGLLGSAWGIMDVFSRIGAGGTVRISYVAPGIAAALLATVVGLLVAVPSLFSYNLFSARIRVTTVEMENFASEFLAAVNRHHLREKEL
jgi:biopolymer transport protein TolQ